MLSLLFCFLSISVTQEITLRIPVSPSNGTVHDIRLTRIGGFGVERVARPNIPKHLHTGVDILPPNGNYKTKEYIYPITDGIVISKRTDGPYAQLIIEHEVNGTFVWTVYEHIAGIEVDLFQPVTQNQPIARFFTSKELDKIGWQFNHFHFEVLKKEPLQIKQDPTNLDRRYNAYTLSCFDQDSLNEHYYDPLMFLKE